MLLCMSFFSTVKSTFLSGTLCATFFVFYFGKTRILNRAGEDIHFWNYHHLHSFLFRKPDVFWRIQVLAYILHEDVRCYWVCLPVRKLLLILSNLLICSSKCYLRNFYTKHKHSNLSSHFCWGILLTMYFFGLVISSPMIFFLFLGECTVPLNNWDFCLQRSFPLTEEEYLLRLDDVANTLKCWGAVSLVRNSLENMKKRPRIGKVIYLP